MDMKMNQKFFAVLTAAMLGSAGAAHAISLQSLIANNGTVTLGDKTWSNFGFTATGLNAGVIADLTAAANGLDVVATVSGGVYYLCWNGAIGIANTGTGNLWGDLLLNYTVTASAGHIDSIDQSYTPNATPAQGTISIGETVQNNSNVTVANSRLDITDLSDPLPEIGDDLIVNPSETVLHVTKDIFFFAIAPVAPETVNFVGLSQVKQSFHQVTVPDGGTTVMMLGAALSGLVLLRRKLVA